MLNVKRIGAYKPATLTGEYTISGDNISCYETTALFWLSNYQYLFSAVAFSVAAPFRKEIWTNWIYSVCILGILGLSLAVHFIDHKNVVAEFFSVSRFELVSYDT